ncbi:MAG: hypothetical protein U0556_09775 [Dehalococcoidia bacterium]
MSRSRVIVWPVLVGGAGFAVCACLGLCLLATMANPSSQPGQVGLVATAPATSTATVHASPAASNTPAVGSPSPASLTPLANSPLTPAAIFTEYERGTQVQREAYQATVVGRPVEATCRVADVSSQSFTLNCGQAASQVVALEGIAPSALLSFSRDQEIRFTATVRSLLRRGSAGGAIITVLTLGDVAIARGAPVPSPSAPPATPAPVTPSAAPAGPTRTAAPQSTATIQATAAATRGSAECHPSYPDFCIPAPPPDLNCTSAALRALPGYRPGFRVVHSVANPDPHQFDREKDGRGCEG